MSDKIKLSEKPARTDLTDRECAKLLGSAIGGLMTMSDRETVKRAVEWWAENFDASWPRSTKPGSLRG